MKHPTPAYGPTRVLLAIGAVLTALVISVSLADLRPASGFGPPAAVLGLPVDVVMRVAACGSALTGLAWMARIVRGPRAEPPPWRYRDR